MVCSPTNKQAEKEAQISSNVFLSWPSFADFCHTERSRGISHELRSRENLKVISRCLHKGRHDNSRFAAELLQRVGNSNLLHSRAEESLPAIEKQKKASTRRLRLFNQARFKSDDLKRIAYQLTKPPIANTSRFSEEATWYLSSMREYSATSFRLAVTSW